MIERSFVGDSVDIDKHCYFLLLFLTYLKNHN